MTFSAFIAAARKPKASATVAAPQPTVSVLPDWAKPTVVNDDVCMDQPYDAFGFQTHA